MDIVDPKFEVVTMHSTRIALLLAITTACTLASASYHRYRTPIPAVVHVIMIPAGTTDSFMYSAFGQREEVSRIAAAHNALIACNGANYRRGGRFNGNRVNSCIIDGTVLADVGFRRGSLLCLRDGTLAIAMMSLEATVMFDCVAYHIDRINQPRISGEVVLYTGDENCALLSYTPGWYALIKEGEVVSAGFDSPTTIPDGCVVIQMDTAPAYVGTDVQITYKVVTENMSDEVAAYRYILGGAGLIVKDSQICCDNLYEEFAQGKQIAHSHDEIVADFHPLEAQANLIEVRHPRTAIGTDHMGTVYVVVVDGRQEESQGMTLRELAFFMRDMGCCDVLNIGGGGCSTLWVDGLVINNPSQGAERPVSEAICFKAC